MRLLTAKKIQLYMNIVREIASLENPRVLRFRQPVVHKHLPVNNIKKGVYGTWYLSKGTQEIVVNGGFLKLPPWGEFLSTCIPVPPKPLPPPPPDAASHLEKALNVGSTCTLLKPRPMDLQRPRKAP